MKKINSLFVFVIIAISCFAQKQTFDVLNYTAPKGWDKTEMSQGIQLSAKNDGKGNYAAAVILSSAATTASA